MKKPLQHSRNQDFLNILPWQTNSIFTIAIILLDKSRFTSSRNHFSDLYQATESCPIVALRGILFYAKVVSLVVRRHCILSDTSLDEIPFVKAKKLYHIPCFFATFLLLSALADKL